MINYYCYSNIDDFDYYSDPLIYLAAINHEMISVVNNGLYINKLFVKHSLFNIYSNKLITASNAFMFYKVYEISIILKTISFVLGSDKLAHALVLNVLMSVNNVFCQKQFSLFKINLYDYDILNFSNCSIITPFDFLKKPTHLIFFYFYLNIYKIFIGNTNTMFLVKTLLQH